MKKGAMKPMLAVMPMAAGSDKPYKPPSEKERVVSHARNAKVNATQDWIDGRIDTKQHENVHKRANHVIAKKGTVKGFRGKTGERKPEKMPW